MPESCDDRPATAVEYVYLLSKSNDTTFWTHRDHEGSRTRPKPDYRWVHEETRQEVVHDPHDPDNWRRVNLWRGRDYYFDADAVRVDGFRAAGVLGNRNGFRGNGIYTGGRSFTNSVEQGPTQTNTNDGVQSNRNRRNSDWFFESWQGLLLDERDEPLALVVNPAPFKGAHFATFPAKLVEPMVKASTSEKGQCPECGAPWVRIVDRGELVPTRRQYDKRPYGIVVENPDPSDAGRNRARDGHRANMAYERLESGWKPSCAHIAEPVPQAVLDPFGGAGTVGLVADRLGRNVVLIDLKGDYSEMAAERLRGDAPMFVDLETA